MIYNRRTLGEYSKWPSILLFVCFQFCLMRKLKQLIDSTHKSSFLNSSPKICETQTQTFVFYVTEAVWRCCKFWLASLAWRINTFLGCFQRSSIQTGASPVSLYIVSIHHDNQNVVDETIQNNRHLDCLIQLFMRTFFDIKVWQVGGHEPLPPTCLQKIKYLFFSFQSL